MNLYKLIFTHWPEGSKVPKDDDSVDFRTDKNGIDKAQEILNKYHRVSPGAELYCIGRITRVFK